MLCELDWIKVKGKADALACYGLIAERGAATRAKRAYPQDYAVALVLPRGPLAEAAWCWQRAVHPHPLPTAPPPPLVMAGRCSELQASPPTQWDGVFVKTTK